MLEIPKCNGVDYELDGGSFICVRPSGTEPKLKIYYSVRAENEEKANEALEQAKKSVEALLQSVKK